MKADVIITGHMRTFDRCVHSLRWQVLRHYDVAAFYVATVKDEDAHKVDLLAKLFPGVPVNVDIVAEQPTIPEPAESVRFEPYARSVPVQAVLRQLWQLERGLFIRENFGGKAPIIIRVRPDLFFHSFTPPEITDTEPQAFTPYWGRFGGVNDRFSVMTQSAAESYFDTFNRIKELMDGGCPLHPESLVAASLWSDEVKINDTLETEFTTMRKDGQHRPPEITIMDLAHCGLRK